MLGGRFGNRVCLQALKRSSVEQTALAEQATPKQLEQEAVHNCNLGEAQRVNNLALHSCSVLHNVCSKLLRGCCTV